MESHRVCPVCKDDMTTRNPRMLPCVHSFCTTCLEGLVQHQKWSKKQMITCPVCRKTVKLSSKGITAIPGNFLLYDDLQNKANPQRQRKCSVCEDKEKAAVVWCRECYKDLCQACKKKHLKIKGFQDHTFRSILSGMCGEHKEIIQYICNYCNIELCATCAYNDLHTMHGDKIIKIEEGCVELKDTIYGKTVKMQRPLEKKLSHLISVKESIECRKSEIEVHAKELSDKITKAKKTLLSQLDEQARCVNKLTAAVKLNLETMKRVNELCSDNRKQYDYNFYSMLQCLDISTENDAEAGKMLCYDPVSVPIYLKQDLSMGKLESTKENLEDYPIPIHRKDEYSLDEISVCSDTVYESFLSNRRTECFVSDKEVERNTTKQS